MSKLTEYLRDFGRLPPVSLTIRPLNTARKAFKISNFLTYSFRSSMLVPVDSFEFSFKNPTQEGPLRDSVLDGDIVILEANGTTLATGIVDVVEITTDESGEVVSLHGRDLLSQFEDQSAVSIVGDPIWGNKMAIQQAVDVLRRNTRIPRVRLQDAPKQQYLLATDPSENKLSALQRFTEPLNCLFWCDPDGALVVGRPNMAQAPLGELICSREPRNITNVTTMRAVYSSTQIPSVILPIWAGQESVQSRVAKEQALFNTAEGPARLRQAGHLLPRAVVVSTPRGADPQSLAAVNTYRVSTAGGGNLLQATAKREIARANVQELVVEAMVRGHYNDSLAPFMADTVYSVRYPRAGVERKMYLYEVEYSLDGDTGQRTNLKLCNLGTIVSDVRAR